MTNKFKTKKQIWIDGLGKKERSYLLNEDGGIHGISDPNSKIVVEVKNGYISVWGADKKHPLIVSGQVELGAMDRVFNALKIAIEEEAL